MKYPKKITNVSGFTHECFILLIKMVSVAITIFLFQKAMP